MAFTPETGIPVLTVFLQGLLSFFSPCVLPLIPLYLGYLSGNAESEEGDRGTRRRTALHTIFFVIGISFAFFVLGMGMSAVGMFFRSRQMMFARIGGMLVILFGLYQLGLFGRPAALERERRLPFRFDKMAMSPVTAFLMGFVFSFAWTPCVGPALSSVLLMAAGAATRGMGLLLIGVYTMGFVIPFLIVGFFGSELLIRIRKQEKLLRYTVKAGGVLLVLMGVMMLTGRMNAVTGYLSSVTQSAEAGSAAESTEAGAETAAGSTEEQTAEAGTERADGKESSAEPNADAESTESAAGESESESSGEEEEQVLIPAHPFSLYDQYGNLHELEQYRGKVVFLNFWATWCPPCRAEMPDIQKLYEKYSGEDSEVVVLGVATPDGNGEGSREEITAFLEENGYTYPVLMDTELTELTYYAVTSFPTTYMLDRNGNFYGYITGAISGSMMQKIVDQTLEAER